MKPLTGSFLSFCAEPLCLHESHLRQMFIEHVVNTKSDARPIENASCDLADYLPTVDELIVADGVAVVPIHGVMMKRTQIWVGYYNVHIFVGSDHWSMLTDDLCNRNDLHTIVYDFDTGGGQVAGTERLGDSIWKARQSGKTTIAVVNEFCASAGLWVGSQCERVVIPATGSIGSLGVYTIHTDNTKAWAEFGFEKTVIHRGKYKGIDERPLDADAQADLQRFIDGKYSLFVDAVARGRGLSAEEVTKRWGDSQLFTGSEAVSSGLADEIGTLQDVLESLRAGRGGRVSIEAPPADNDPQADHIGDENAMLKLNATGQILDASGKVVGNVSELQIDAAGLTKYFAAQSGELIDSAVKTAKDAAAETQKAAVADAEKASHARLDTLVAAVGAEKAVVAFKAGHSVETAKASLADDLVTQLKAKDAEIAALKANGGNGSGGPRFVPTDAGGAGDGKPPALKADGTVDKDAPYAAAFENDGEGYPSLAAFAARKRYEEKQTARQ